MPFRKGFSFVYKSVGACFGKPFELSYFFSVKLYAFALSFKSVLVVRASAGITVQKVTGDSCVQYSFVPQVAFKNLMVAAFSASVAQGFPFSGIHLR